ncbi:MAG: type II toxin-antitoxin system VapC family toxin [Acidobacteriota bacterium]
MKAVFVDTSAIYALLVAEDQQHARATEALAWLERERASLVSTSFILHESAALLQSRIGVSAVRTFHQHVVPALDVEWIDAGHYERAMVALVAANRRDVSLADWTSFDVMRRRGIDRAFAFDPHFAEQEFAVLP